MKTKFPQDLRTWEEKDAYLRGRNDAINSVAMWAFKAAMLVALVLALSSVLASCAGTNVIEPERNSTAVDTNVKLPPIEWRIRSKEEIVRLYRSAGMRVRDGEFIDSFVASEGEKIVIYTPPPQRVDDQVTTSLGHEVMHVAFGSYHRRKDVQ